MADVSRLLDLLQVLRCKRRPVSAAVLAEELGVSTRTLYRDINRLRATGADIEGEAGVGYVLQPGFLLPPLMLTEDEIESLTLGLTWVRKVSDPMLAAAAENTLAKIAFMLPPELRIRIETTPLVVGNTTARPARIDPAELRHAMRSEQKLSIHYVDAQGNRSVRVVWPLALGFLELTRMLVCWCELRQDFRLFRLDRIEQVVCLSEHYPERRQLLYRQWQASLLPDSVIGSFYAESESTERVEEQVMSKKELVLYTNPWSRGAIAHWMLEEIGEPYRIEMLEYGPAMKSEAFLALNPMGKVPTLCHGDQVVTEAAAICAYLADAFPQAGLAPPPAMRGDYYRWLFFTAGPLEQAISLQSLDIQLSAEDAARLGCGSTAQVVNILAGALKERRYLAGDRFSAADVYVGSHLAWGMEFGTIEKRPEFVDYWQGLKERPAHRKVEKMLNTYMAHQNWSET